MPEPERTAAGVFLATLDLVDRGDLEAAVAYFHPDGVWEHNVGLGTPMEGVYRGHDEILGLWRTILESFGTYRFEIDEARDVTETQAAVFGRLLVSGDQSGASVQSEIGSVADVEEGLITRARCFLDRAKALALLDRS